MTEHTPLPPIHAAVTEGNLEKVLELMKAAEDEYQTPKDEDSSDKDSSDEGSSLDDYINPRDMLWVDFERIFGKNWIEEHFIECSNVEGETRSVTPLHLAALFGHEEIFNAIFEKVY